MAVLFIEYPKCTTCKKAKKWLDEHGVEYVDRISSRIIPRQRSWRSGTSAPVFRCAASSTRAV